MRASFECAIQKYHTPFIIGDDGIFDRMPVCHYNAFFVSGVMAIVTPKPIDWKALGADIVKGLRGVTVWGLKELVVEVN